jgi:hypothetical protein
MTPLVPIVSAPVSRTEPTTVTRLPTCSRNASVPSLDARRTHEPSRMALFDVTVG